MENLTDKELLERRFNVRVYGLFVHSHLGVLLSHEELSGFKFTKFPGGGLEWGEGLTEGLCREIREELTLDLNINLLEHYYTTDFFQVSAFRPADQIISVYYKVAVPAEIQNADFTYFNEESKSKKQLFQWCSWTKLAPESCTFPIDQRIIQQLIQSRTH